MPSMLPCIQKMHLEPYSPCSPSHSLTGISYSYCFLQTEVRSAPHKYCPHRTESHFPPETAHVSRASAAILVIIIDTSKPAYFSRNLPRDHIAGPPCGPVFLLPELVSRSWNGIFPGIRRPPRHSKPIRQSVTVSPFTFLVPRSSFEIFTTPGNICAITSVSNELSFPVTTISCRPSRSAADTVSIRNRLPASRSLRITGSAVRNSAVLSAA